MDTQAGRAKSYYFPRKPEDDVIVNILKTVGTPVGTDNPCHGNDATRYGTSDGRTVVRVAMHGITRTEVAKQLVALDQAACYVDVVYRRMSDDVKKIFDARTRSTAVSPCTGSRTNARTKPRSPATPPRTASTCSSRAPTTARRTRKSSSPAAAPTPTPP
ncbi:hypothetical protein [Streptomyces sp. enrichment culture]|uniref:hypothetical protein n=1 Tax=Streptomyces sp. enrichment culture TaxID=1795815 RepID=UPI003F5674C9